MERIDKAIAAIKSLGDGEQLSYTKATRSIIRTFAPEIEAAL